MIIARRIQVYGRVQGVFFRASAAQKAQELHLKGFASNLSDGSVLIQAEGEESDVQNLIDWCKIGPELSQVTNVETSEVDVQDFEEFQIQR